MGGSQQTRWQIGRVAGATLLGLGVGVGLDAVVDWSVGLPWTVGLGGTIGGLGLGILVLSTVATARTVRALPAVLIVVGGVIAGWALAAGADNFLRRIDGEDYSAGIAFAIVGAGLGVMSVGVSLMRRT